MHAARWITLGLTLGAGILALSARDAIAEAPVVTKPVAGPVVSPAAPNGAPTLAGKNLHAPVAPLVFNTGACGVAQTLCFLSGGKVPSPLAKDSPDNVRNKICVLGADPKYGCGTCAFCPLIHTVGAFCGAAGCDYRACEQDWADEDGNRKNGCEQYRPKAPAPPPGAFRCGADAQCAYLGENDGLNAHPHGECKPADHAADAHGCLFVYAHCPPFRRPDQYAGCHPDVEHAPYDLDHDGQWAKDFGGIDCDDGDSARFPGNAETCDTFNHDEDCDTSTTGAPDADRDLQPDGACCNVLPNGAKFCGTDCDDKNSALALSAQRCAPDGSTNTQVCVVDRSGGGQVATWTVRPCAAGLVCKPQPTGLGICE
jgi:hypothetical protein